MDELFFLRVSHLKIPFAYWDERRVSSFLRNIRGRAFLDVGADRGYCCALLSDNFRIMYAVVPSRESVRTMQRLFRHGIVRPVITESAANDHEGSTAMLKALIMLASSS